ncbi:MAG: hypothetical protein IJX28_04605 [Clostridia bacterium]|nr:hypothetical protein [Clostridia bacterium]
MKSPLFFCSLLISGAILAGCALVAGSELVWVGLGGMLISCIWYFSTPIAKYFATFYPKVPTDQSK